VRRHPLNVQKVRLGVPPPSPPRIWTFLSRLRRLRAKCDGIAGASFRRHCAGDSLRRRREKLDGRV